MGFHAEYYGFMCNMFQVGVHMGSEHCTDQHNLYIMK